MVHGLEVEPMVRPSGGAMVKQNERFCVWQCGILLPGGCFCFGACDKILTASCLNVKYVCRRRLITLSSPTSQTATAHIIQTTYILITQRWTQWQPFLRQRHPKMIRVKCQLIANVAYAINFCNAIYLRKRNTQSPDHQLSHANNVDAMKLLDGASRLPS